MKSRARASFLRKTEKKKNSVTWISFDGKVIQRTEKKKKYKGNYKYGIMHFPFF